MRSCPLGGHSVNAAPADRYGMIVVASNAQGGALRDPASEEESHVARQPWVLRVLVE